MKPLPNPASVKWPSAGRSLGILVAVVAVLWLWLQLPDFYQAGHRASETGQWLAELVYNDWSALALMLVANVLVARYTTAPMWRLGHSIELQGMRGAFVFVLGTLFHLVVAGCGVAVLVLGSGWLETGA
ncbi:hypothetical protein [Hymenobacter cellulosilyticus]|uniref:Uncharacterized protein n=1 Tax=Hymenobacter cellulosilyticus TaxID=2932248 RepID=A0A8T9Q6Z6_9BACT|nr:hypothetical protein [Hymenobacter cellulosilyticus]UOQ72181.1 hypothetical protein MUN79_27065 [Hymenobacter cellulosilyticus]